MKLTKEQFDELVNKGLKPIDHSLSGFAEACYDDNTYHDLIGALDESEPADKVDMKAWGLTQTEWRGAIKQALEQAMYNFNN